MSSESSRAINVAIARFDFQPICPKRRRCLSARWAAEIVLVTAVTAPTDLHR